MRIKHLELKDWGPHKHINLDIDNEIVGIVGANGAGKSKILNAIEYALTGNLNKFKQESYIRNFGQEGGATSAFVRLVFNKDGKDYEIKRSISATGSKRSLKFDGKEITKAADVEKELCAILSADKNSLSQAVFTKQGSLLQLIKGTPSDRQTLFQSIMNIKFVEPRADDVGNRINSLSSSITDVTPVIELLNTQLSSVEEKLKSVTEVLTKLDGINEIALILNSLLKTATEAYNLNAKINETEQTITKAKDYIKNKLEEIGCKEYQDIDAIIESISKELDELKNIQNKKYYAEKYKAEKETILTDVKNRMNKLLSYKSIDDCTKEINKLTAELLDLNKAKNIAVNIKIKSTSLEGIEKEQDKLKNELVRSMQFESGRKKELINRLNDLGKQQSILLIEIDGVDTKLAVLNNPDTVVCPVCSSPLKKEAIVKDGETIEQAKIRLNSEKKNKTKLLDDLVREANNLSEEINSVTPSKNIISSLIEVQNKVKLCKEDIDKANSEIKALCNYSLDAINEVGDSKQKELLALTRDKISIQEHWNIINENNKRLKVIDEKLSDSVNIPDNLDHNISLLSNKLMTFNIAKCDIDTYIKSIKDCSIKLENSKVRLSTTIDEFNKDAQWIYSNDLSNCLWCKYGASNAITIHSIDDFQRILFGIQSNELVEYRSASVQSKELKDELKSIKRKLSLALAQDKENGKIKVLIEDLKVVKSLLSRSGIPLAFMCDVFEKIAVSVQEILNRMAANFSIIIDKEKPCSFLFSRTDDDSGFLMPQEQLSGGQAMRLSIAILIACQRIILPEVGLLILDEPSSHIDSAGVEQLRDMFMSLQSTLKNTNMQLIIVDHNEKLKTAFDKIISVL